MISHSRTISSISSAVQRASARGDRARHFRAEYASCWMFCVQLPVCQPQIKVIAAVQFVSR
jgi:hypothetical protein